MKFAYIQDNTVTQVLRVPPTNIYPPEFAAQFIPCADDVEVGWILSGETLIPPPLPPLADRQAAAWDRIKAERDRRKHLGVKVGAHWYHSDDPSRIQQLALAMMGAAIPAGLMWKTLTLTPPPVFVEMTPALAQGIFQATAASDAAIFAAAEAHRVAVESSDDPQGYDCSGGWPESIEDAQ